MLMLCVAGTVGRTCGRALPAFSALALLELKEQIPVLVDQIG